jgi:hypothetical protein
MQDEKVFVLCPSKMFNVNNRCVWMYPALCTSMLAVLFAGSCSTSPRPDGISQTQAQSSSAEQGSPRRPLISFSQDITSPVHEITMKAGSNYTLEIAAKNTGGEPWIQQGTGEMPVNAGYRWVDHKGAVLPFEGTRANLSRTVLNPGETDHLKLTIKAEPTPGTYNVWVSMVQEGVAWFYDKHASPLVVRVTIT